MQVNCPVNLTIRHSLCVVLCACLSICRPSRAAPCRVSSGWRTVEPRVTWTLCFSSSTCSLAFLRYTCCFLCYHPRSPEGSWVNPLTNTESLCLLLRLSCPSRTTLTSQKRASSTRSSLCLVTWWRASCSTTYPRTSGRWGTNFYLEICIWLNDWLKIGFFCQLSTCTFHLSVADLQNVEQRVVRAGAAGCLRVLHQPGGPARRTSQGKSPETHAHIFVKITSHALIQ